MRIAVTLLVVVAMTVIGVQAAMRLGAGEGAPPARATAEAVATAWAAALGEGDVDALVALGAERSDLDELRAAHADTLTALGTLTAQVTGVAEDGNRARAQLAYDAAPVAGAAWQWETTLSLIRGGGEWSVDWIPTALHPELDTGWRFAVDVTEASRAPVLDREGRALSRTGDVVEIGVQPGRLPDRNRTLLTVANALPAAFEPLQELLDRDDLNDDWYYPLTTVPVAVADEAWPDLLTLPGLLRRDAEAGTGAATAAVDIVGAIGTGEDGERVGTSGLEQIFDERLGGSATTVVQLLDPGGGQRGTLYTFQQDVRPPLVTTLDLDVQLAVEEVADAAEVALGIVVVDAATGGIVAVTSRPGTGFNRALEGQYPPALVAGLVPVTAALVQGAVATDPLDCPPSGTAGGVTVSTTTPRGEQQGTLAEALTGACDVGVARLGDALGDDALLDAVTVLGLGAQVELPVPAVGWSWPATDTAAARASAAVGHAQVQSSALGVASLAAAVARGAPAVPVLLVEEVTAPTPFPPAVAAGLREVMRTAGGAGEVGAPGVRVAGIRAAAGVVRGDPAPRTGWWAGFLEGDGPDLAVAVVVEGDDGSRAASLADRVVDVLATLD